MDKSKNKKLYISVAVVFIIAIAITLTVIFSFSGQNDISRALRLGDRYLSNMDYKSAIIKYCRVLSMDPNNEDALAGLAMSYMGLGNNEKTKDIFENYLSDTKRPELLEAYSEMLANEGDYVKAVSVVQELISIRDADEDYEWMAEIISKSMSSRHDYSDGPSVTVEIRDGKVNTRGNNELGALGTTTNLGVDSYTNAMSSANFDGRAVGVYSFGANSAVIDENGALWLAGSNRSGQKGGGSTQMIVTGGWNEITPPTGTVVKVAGFDSTIFALTDDGALWVVGQNGGYVSGTVWFENWTRVSGYGVILDLQYSQNTVAFLNDAGTVYKINAGLTDSYGYVSASWSIVSRDVSRFSLSNSDIFLCTTDGRLNSEKRNISYPEAWVIKDTWGIPDGYEAPFTVQAIASMENSLFVLSSEGVLHHIMNGVDTELEINGAIETIYTSGSSCVIEIKDGGYLLFDGEGKQI